MKILLCLFLIQVYSCLGSSEQGHSSNYWRGFFYDDLNHGHQPHKPIERPCLLQDISCIRRYFAHNSQCSPVHGPASDLQRIKIVPMFTPHVNVTFVLNDAEIEGFNDFRIKEFYVNKETDTLVLEVEFRRLRVYSPFMVITFHRKGKEPLVVADYGFIEYRDISLTLTAHVRDIKLSEAHVYTYISDVAPKYRLGPNFTQSKEPQVREVVPRFVGNMGLSLQEAFVTQGPVFMSVFLQNSICRQ